MTLGTETCLRDFRSYLRSKRYLLAEGQPGRTREETDEGLLQRLKLIGESFKFTGVLSAERQADQRPLDEEACEQGAPCEGRISLWPLCYG